jgi:ubiquinone/menaquinone biosynthesis C-methylase UbiE
LLAAAVLAWGQAAQEANRNYRTREGRAALAAGLSSPDRDKTQRPNDLVRELAIAPGSKVVDLGTGPGYMLPYLSRAVGNTGRVLAEDIQTDFLDRAKSKARQDGLTNIEFLLGTDTDPRLPAAAADLILVLDVYHHFDYPERMLAALRRALKPGGRLAIVEYYKRRGAMGENSDFALHHIRLDADDLIREVESNGFRLISRKEHIPGSQYIAVFHAR